MTTRTQGRLPVDGAELDFDVTGPQAPTRTLIAAHGMLSSRARDQRGGLDWSPLAATHRLVRYDARGHGHSTGRPEPGDFTWPNLAHDLLTLRRHLVGSGPVDHGFDGPVDALGASMGCGTVLQAAVAEPEAFHKLVLVIPPTAWRTRAEQAGGWAAAADLVENHGKAGFVRAMAMNPQPPIVAELTDGPIEPDVAEALLPSVLRGAARSDFPDAEHLAALPHPTLILGWPDDPVHPIETVEALRTAMRDVRVRLAASADDVRHWPAQVRDFLDADR